MTRRRSAAPRGLCEGGWGCDRYCAADDLACGNGTIRTPHPCELFGADWDEWAAARGTADRTEPRPSPSAE